MANYIHKSEQKFLLQGLILLPFAKEAGPESLYMPLCLFMHLAHVASSNLDLARQL